MALRCLIVDDNPGFLHAARALLEHEGVRIVGVASTGAEAVQRAAELRPDVTLLDIDLGDDSGFELAQRLVDDPDAEPGQLILISAHAEEDLVDLLEASPVVGFLGKPELSATAIERLLRRTGEPDGIPGHSEAS